MQIRTFSLLTGLAALGLSAQAQVSLSIDSSTTLSQASWSGSPALPLNPPNGGSSIDGGFTSAVLFQPTTAFTLGSFEFYANSGGAGATSVGTYGLDLYDLGPSYTLPGASPAYTYTGSEVDLFDAGLNFTTTSTAQFNVLTFSGDDQVALNAGDNYLLSIVSTTGESMDIERGSNTTGSGNPNFATQALLEAGAAPANGVALNLVPAGHRDVVGAFYPVAAPEPTSLALLGLGGLAGAFMRRRKV